jgi:uncharacterized protein YjbI with pentapeptide repeats
VEQEEQQPSKQTAGWERSLGDRLLRTLRMDPNRWTVGDRRLVILAIAIGLTIVAITVCGYVFGWKWTGLAKRTFWDWLSLLIVPIVLALGGYLFTRSENRRTREDADQQRELDRELADERRQDDMLQAYLDGMSQLLTDEARPLHRAQLGDSLSTVARARTLTVLTRLEGERKGSVVRFLYESGLITKDRLILDLRSADLSGAYLIGANLSRADLSGVTLFEAYLGGANLSAADLSGATLYGASLIAADLSGANLSWAKLYRVNLSRANLSGATGISNELERLARSLKGATMPNGQKYEEWLKSKGGGENTENSGP